MWNLHTTGNASGTLPAGGGFSASLGPLTPQWPHGCCSWCFRPSVCSVHVCNRPSCKHLHARSFLDLKGESTHSVTTATAPSHPSSRVTSHLFPSSTKPPTVSRDFVFLFAF